jgi:hypothetical protein
MSVQKFFIFFILLSEIGNVGQNEQQSIQMILPRQDAHVGDAMCNALNALFCICISACAINMAKSYLCI